MTKKTLPSTYENNPFFIATNGITALFNLAQGVAVMFIIFSIINVIVNTLDSSDTASGGNTNLFDNWSTSEFALLGGSIAIITLAIILIATLFNGVSAYTSAQIAQGKRVSLGTAFRVSFDNLWSFLWLQIVIVVKIFLWSLLFIIPGLIMAVRYSLAGVAFYDESAKVRGNAAVKESIRLTKNAWLTTYAANALMNVLTLGAISSVLSIGTNAVLYKQFQESGDQKPAAHILSWLTLVLPFALLSFIAGLIIFIGIIFGVFS